jgi:hypothetical protein
MACSRMSCSVFGSTLFNWRSSDARLRASAYSERIRVLIGTRANGEVTFVTNGGRGEISSIEACLELFGVLVAYRRVTPLAIVPAFDVLKDRPFGFIMRLVIPMMD